MRSSRAPASRSRRSAREWPHEVRGETAGGEGFEPPGALRPQRFSGGPVIDGLPCRSPSEWPEPLTDASDVRFAEGVGFEPTGGLPPQQFSRLPPSSARSPLPGNPDRMTAVRVPGSAPRQACLEQELFARTLQHIQPVVGTRLGPLDDIAFRVRVYPSKVHLMRARVAN